MRERRRKRMAIPAVLTAAVLLVCACTPGAPAMEAAGPVREEMQDGIVPMLSEVCCANFTLLTNPVTGRYEDYIELYNPTGQLLDIGGYIISDRQDPGKGDILPEIGIGPYGYLILWADGSDTVTAYEAAEDTQAGCALTFQLSEGETVHLFSKDGMLLDSVTLPAPHKNCAAAKLDGTWAEGYGTPGYSNADAVRYYPPTLSAPCFDHRDGFYAEPFCVTISAPEEGTIYYTLDGSVPDRNSAVYTEPGRIYDRSEEPNEVVSRPEMTRDRAGAVTDPVPKGTVLRAAVIREDASYSETATAVYFVGETAEAYEGKAVLSVTADPDDLFGEYGICVTGPAYDAWYDKGKEGDEPWPQYLVRGRATERDAELLLFDKGQSVLQDRCGIRLGGHSSRERQIKRLNFYARKIYAGSNTFSETPFPGMPEHTFSIREGKTDIIAQSLADGLGIGGLAVYDEPVLVFVNGEYYTETYIRERYDSQYFANHFGAAKDDVVLISANELDQGTYADYEDYCSFITFIEENDVSDPAVYAEVQNRMDVENYAAYVAFRLYVNDTDWDLFKNEKIWRVRTPGGEGALDGRWRWVISDLDALVWIKDWAVYDPFLKITPGTEKTFLEMPVFGSLMKNPSFKALFVKAWMRMANEVCTPERVMPLIREYEIENKFPDGIWYLVEERQNAARVILMEALDFSEEELQSLLEQDIG